MEDFQDIMAMMEPNAVEDKPNILAHVLYAVKFTLLMSNAHHDIQTVNTASHQSHLRLTF